MQHCSIHQGAHLKSRQHRLQKEARGQNPDRARWKGKGIVELVGGEEHAHCSTISRYPRQALLDRARQSKKVENSAHGAGSRERVAGESCSD